MPRPVARELRPGSEMTGVGLTAASVCTVFSLAGSRSGRMMKRVVRRAAGCPAAVARCAMLFPDVRHRPVVRTARNARYGLVQPGVGAKLGWRCEARRCTRILVQSI
jgi:apolipoprotein N-acyltransferase